MTSQEQALAIADRWLNPDGSTEPRREVRMHEFDLGWVVWAAPAGTRGESASGERQPPTEAGNACGVVDRGTGELTVWPSAPVDEVVRMYRQKHSDGTQGQNSQGGALPVTGPGNTAVFTYVDPANGEETTLFRTSGSGLPPAEHQAWADLRRMNVSVESVLAVHTDLSPSLLPGGYTAELLNMFSDAQLSFSQPYGSSPEERAEGVVALTDQVEAMHRMAGRQPPPRPHRVPLPAQVTPAEPMSDAALGELLVEAFGEDGVRRYDAEEMVDSELPESTRSTLTLGGVPVGLPLFFTADRADAPPAGGLFTDVATNLRRRRSPADDEKIGVLAHLARIGFDGVAVIAVQCRPGAGQPDGFGALWAVDPVEATSRYVNFSVAAFARSLALLATVRERMQGLDPIAAGAEVAALQEQLAAIDASALANDETWWSLIVEQMWHGLF
ncbi:SUKH-4 family immunity protein [Streptomyces sp. Lzd4kr]|nr:SUKH-4 family immunity protein [Streptomyces sp. Lzd4kr]